jgi:hypothetical protein
MRFNLLLLFCVGLISCGQSAKTQTEVNSDKKTITPVIQAGYEIYLLASRTAINPPDEITLDSNGQMVVISQQLMQDGTWKKPKGLAKIEPEDKALLDSLIGDDILYSISEEDVLPPCPDGADYIIKIDRKDRSRIFSLKANTCAIEENTLSGRQRPVFKKLITLFEAMRSKYRPAFFNKGN